MALTVAPEETRLKSAAVELGGGGGAAGGDDLIAAAQDRRIVGNGTSIDDLKPRPALNTVRSATPPLERSGDNIGAAPTFWIPPLPTDVPIVVAPEKTFWMLPLLVTSASSTSAPAKMSW